MPERTFCTWPATVMESGDWEAYEGEYAMWQEEFDKEPTEEMLAEMEQLDYEYNRRKWEDEYDDDDFPF